MSAFTIGKFQVLGTLGAGAHSTILHVRREADSKHYALKVVPIGGADELKFLEQAEHEFAVARMLDHPSLVKVYALETQKDWLFRVRKAHLLIEYVNGKTLDALPPLPLPRLVQVFARAASALEHMHQRHVCHADLKPNNILLSRAGEVKVIDFGLAWIKGESKGRIQGTPEYMAPEQARRKVVNESTDVYNLGATMYRMVTGRLPPSALPNQDSGISLNADAWKALLKPARDLAPQAPRALCDLIDRCLSFHPPQRPGGAGDVRATLDLLVRKLVRAPEDRLEMTEF